MADIVLLTVICVTFALVSVAHLGIVAGLFWRKLWLQAVVALLLAPSAPYWAYLQGMRTRAGLWIVGAAFYAIAAGLCLWRR